MAYFNGRKDFAIILKDSSSTSGSTDVDTCTVSLDVGTFGAFNNNNVLVFYTTYKNGNYSWDYKTAVTDVESTVLLNDVVCNSSICVYTPVGGYSDAANVTYTNEVIHVIRCSASSGETETITFTETS